MIRPDGDELDVDVTTFADHRRLGMTLNRLGVIRSPSKLIVRGRLVRDPRGLRHKKNPRPVSTATAASTKTEPRRQAQTPNPKVLLRVDELPEQQSSDHSPIGDEGELSVGDRATVDRTRLRTVIAGWLRASRVVERCERLTVDPPIGY